MSETKKYYWLKLKKDFFKRHDIKIIESMPNGKDYILFYLKLLVESVDHEGNLRFNDTIPYDENMLSIITNTDIDKVKSAMKIFTELKMIDIMQDNTIFMNEVEKMLGTETYWAEQKRKQRDKEVKEIGQCPKLVQQMSIVSNQELETDIELETELELKVKLEDKPKPYVADFDLFWSKYPKKINKLSASKAWKKIKHSDELFNKIIDSLDKHIKSVNWLKDNGQFIPHGASWLNGERWNDEVEEAQTTMFNNGGKNGENNQSTGKVSTDDYYSTAGMEGFFK